MSVAEPNADLLPAEITRIGQILRQSRTQKGMTTEDVSGALHLQVRQIEAIEKGDYSAFSSPAIVKGHLRSFARLYGLDGNNLVHLFESSVPLQRPHLPKKTGAIKRMVLLPGASNESVILALLLVVIASLLITLTAYLWTVFNSRDWSDFFATGNIAAIKPDISRSGTGKTADSPQPVLFSKPEVSTQPAADDTSFLQSVRVASATDVVQASQEAVLHIAFSDDCTVKIESEDGVVLHDKHYKRGDVFDMAVSARIHIYFSRANAVLISYKGSSVEVPVRPGVESAELILGENATRSE